MWHSTLNGGQTATFADLVGFVDAQFHWPNTTYPPPPPSQVTPHNRTGSGSGGIGLATPATLDHLTRVGDAGTIHYVEWDQHFARGSVLILLKTGTFLRTGFRRGAVNGTVCHFHVGAILGIFHLQSIAI